MSGLFRGLYSSQVRDMIRKGLKSPSAERMGNTRGIKKRKRDYADAELYKRRRLSQFESLIYYFGEDWFDLERDYVDKIQKGRENLTLNQPSRCPKCKKAWAIESGEPYDLDEEVFVNLPMESQECGC